jgi:uncharacterized protein involved in exopolysaccharide biosynthesis
MSNDFRTVGLSELWALVRAHWRAIGLTTLFTTSVSLAAALLIPPVYRAEVTLAPVKQQANGLGGLASMAGQLGGLASLAGISLGSNDSYENVAILKSRALTETFISENDLLPVLFSRLWDSQSKRWKAAKVESIPTLWDGNKLFQKKIQDIRLDQKTGLVSLTIDWKSPQIAASWANGIVKRCNTLVRDRAMGIGERNIAYLEDQLKKTDLAQVQQAISQILEAEIKNVMVTKGTEEYAFKIIDPAVVPKERYSPSRTLLVILGIVLGSCGSVTWFFVRDSDNRRSARES